jgi:hypothetical protein
MWFDTKTDWLTDWLTYLLTISSNVTSDFEPFNNIPSTVAVEVMQPPVDDYEWSGRLLRKTNRHLTEAEAQ